MAIVILTVTLNAALDVTYDVPRLRPGQSHRVSAVYARAGGKGVNVARVLVGLGCQVVATGIVGGETGPLLCSDLRLTSVPEAMFEVRGESRRTVTVVSEADGAVTAFNEPGPAIDAAEWAGFRLHLARLLRSARVVVLSGSLPLGLSVDAYAELILLAGSSGALTVVDTSGPALRAAVIAGPDVVKPNSDELLAATNMKDPWLAAQALRAEGAKSVVASLGAAGLVAETCDGAWWAGVGERVRGNPTGAGDACVAAIAAGLDAGDRWPEILRAAVACSTAAVAKPFAGEVDDELRQRMLPLVRVEEHDAAHADR